MYLNYCNCNIDDLMAISTYKERIYLTVYINAWWCILLIKVSIILSGSRIHSDESHADDG